MEKPATGRETFSIHTSDCAELGEWARTVGRWDVEYQQISRGPLSAPSALSLFGEAILSDQFFNRSVICRGTPPQDAIAILLPAQGSKSVSFFLGQEVGSHDAIVVRSPCEGLLRTPEGFRLHTITVPACHLEGSLDCFGNADLSSVMNTSKLVRFSPHLLAQFHTLLALRAGSAPEVLDWNTDREIEQETLRLLSEGLLGVQSETRRPRALRNRLTYVREACARIDERLADDVILTDVAKSVGISLRSLENAFVEILGVRPVEYVRTRRLHKVRAHLLKHGTFEGALGQVAGRFGLRHLGYFSRDYKALFGELPGSTVRH